MSDRLARLQDALARLVTDGGVVRAYERAPRETIASIAGDGGGVREALLGLAVPDVVRYAAGLRRKRWDDVATAVPLSVRVVGRLGARYEAWLGAHPAAARADDVLPPGQAEALRALPALTREVARDPGEAPWAAELLAFEVLGACSRADGEARGFVARHAIHAIVEDLRAGLIPVDPIPASHRYAFDGRGVRWQAIT